MIGVHWQKSLSHSSTCFCDFSMYGTYLFIASDVLSNVDQKGYLFQKSGHVHAMGFQTGDVFNSWPGAWTCF